MASGHPYKHHREMHVGHRRVKHLMRSGGHVSDKSMAKAAKSFARKVEEHEHEELGEHKGMARGGRLDKRARGGAIGKYQMGGPIHKLTPRKHKPHTAVHIVNISRGGGGGGGA